MKRVLVEVLPEARKPRRLPDAEAHHLLKVLRLEDGARVEALDGSGRSVIARLSMRAGEAWLEFDGGEKKSAPDTAQVVLEMAVLKGDAMEWVIEKAVELGVARVVPVLSKRTVVQLDRKGPEAFRDRWQKIADQSLKQCGRLGRMEVALPVSLEELLTTKVPDVRFFLDEEARANAPGLLKEAWGKGHGVTELLRLLVGPEGGWDDSERAMVAASGAKPASLGPLVLRAETAAICGVSVLTAALRENHPSS
jgi:16S rRNA (uracil1498-N3)-methyltransferase